MILSILYKAILLKEIMHQPKQWCETLECFANCQQSKFIIPTDNIAYDELKVMRQLESSSTMNRVKKKLLNPQRSRQKAFA